MRELPSRRNVILISICNASDETTGSRKRSEPSTRTMNTSVSSIDDCHIGYDIFVFVLETTTDLSKNATYGFADKDGQFYRKPSALRNFISSDPNSDFPAEKNRYALYIHMGCPWAHRTNIVRSLKGLEDIIQLIVWDMSLVHDKKGWGMSGKPGFEKEPLYGFTNLRQLYEKANPEYEGRYLVPTLWDKKKGKLASRSRDREC
jgi:glutathionyl-hydroquinone reductase